MMGERTVMQEALFYSFRIEDHVPQDHLLRSVDRFVDLTGVREHLKPFYSSTGRPSVDPEWMIRMLFIGYCMGIRSERRLCEEVHLNLAYRWFCRLDLEGSVPDHSTFSKNRHGRFRDSYHFCVAMSCSFLFSQTLAVTLAEGAVSPNSSVMKAMKPDHITILVRSIDRSMPYYDALLPLLGFKKGKPHIWTDGDGFFLQFLEAHADTAPYERYAAGMNHLGFGAPNSEVVEYVRRKMADAGFDVPELQRMKGATALFMKDPDGIRFEITHYPPGVAVVG